MARAVGISLGTTNSVIAVLDGRVPRVIANAEGARSTPSVVAFTGSGEVLVGEAADRQAVTNVDRTIRSVKRHMGTDWTVAIDGKKFIPQQVSAFILQKLKRDAEAYLGENITDAVITVPAYFSDAQRQATKEAGIIAGLDVLRIISESDAAAIAYHLGKAESVKILVFDLGGGSFDVSLYDVGDGVVESLATSGDDHLGGDDWDQRIVDWLVQDFKAGYGLDLSKDKTAMQRLREAAEKAKVELSQSTESRINLPYISSNRDGPLHLDTRLTRAEFQRMTSDLTDRCKAPFQQVIKDANTKVADIDHVVLVGGSTRMPAVVDLVKSLTGGKEPNKGVNPDEVVAVGACLQAGVFTGAVKDVLVLPVTPLSLSIETKGGVFTKIIERNTTIPTKKSEICTTADDNQRSMQIQVYQGEREIAADNKRLGVFDLAGIAPAPGGIPQIEVSFDIDANGIVSVSAKNLVNGKNQHVVMSGGSALPPADIDAMIRDAQAYAGEERRRRAEAEARDRAEREAADAGRQRVDLEGAAGVQVGDGNVQHNYFYFGQQDTGPSAPEERLPYRGLAPFEGADYTIFFGRDDAIDAVMRRLGARGTGIVVVSGASGVGKSSLLRAGVLPWLSRDGLPGSREARAWPRLLFTPGATPLAELAAQVGALAGISGEEARRSLATSPQLFGGLARQAVLTRARQQPERALADLGSRQRLVLVVDQFEQVFRLCRSEDERRAFITALESAATGPEASALVVLVVRSDHERRCAEYPQLMPAIRDRYLVEPMTGDELEQAISRHYPGRPLDFFALIERLLSEVGRNAGALPWLSDALLRTWQDFNPGHQAFRLTLDGYERAGSLIAAAADRAQRVYDTLDESQQDVVRRLLELITALTGAGNRRSGATWEQLYDGMGSTEFVPVLDALADERIVVLSKVGAEICHRGLLEVWPLLRDAVPLPTPRSGPLTIRRLPRVLFAVGSEPGDTQAPTEAEIRAIGLHLRQSGIAVRSRVVTSVTSTTVREELEAFRPDVVHLVAYDELLFEGARVPVRVDREPETWSAEALLRAMQHSADAPRLVIVWLCGRRFESRQFVSRSAVAKALATDPVNVPVVLVAANHTPETQYRAFTEGLLFAVLRGVPLDEAMRSGAQAGDSHLASSPRRSQDWTAISDSDFAETSLVDPQLLRAIDERIDALGLTPPETDDVGVAQRPVGDGVEITDRLLDAGDPLKVLLATGHGERLEAPGSSFLRALAAHAVRAGALPVVVGPFQPEPGVSLEDPRIELASAASGAIGETRVRLGLLRISGTLGAFLSLDPTDLSSTPIQVAGLIRSELLRLVADLPEGDPVWAREPGEPRVMLLCHCADDWQGPVGSLLEMLGPTGLAGDGEPIPVVLAGANTRDVMDALPRFLDKPWSTLLPLNPPPDADGEAAGEAAEIRALAAAGDYRLAEERLARLVGADPQTAESLRLELGFVTLPEPDRRLVATAWAATAIGRTVESVLDRGEDEPSPVISSPDAGEAPAATVTESVAEEPRAEAGAKPRRSAQRSGAVLEQATVDLFARFFAVDREAMVSRLRRQGGGAQFGRDIELECTVAGSPAVRVHVECKNLDRRVTVDDIAGKLAQQRHFHAGAQIDHWILISPHHDGANGLPDMLSAWTDEYPFSVQVWSPQTRVREMFALEPAVYEAVYGRPPTAEEVGGAGEVAGLIKRRLAPRLRVAPVWRRYLTEPSAFCFVNEKQRHFDGLYGRHLALKAADAAGALLDAALMEHVIGWANTDGAAPMLLLADFGEGKSVFTYCLTRRLAEEFAAAPDGALFALRIPLREFNEAGSARGLLERRLNEIGATFADWRALTRQVPTLAILDGFDEMSAKLTRAAISANLRDIESCIRELPDSKILVTSRQRVLDGSRDWWRTLDRLGQPQVVRIVPASRPQRVKYLEQFATDEASAQVLKNLRGLYDPIGLAAKPLFLEMIKDTLRELPGHTFSETILYDTYIDKSLRHKYELLADPDEELTKDELIENLRYILEDVAVRLQEVNGAYLYLRDYRGTGHGKIAELLWKMRDQDVPRDAFSLADQDDAANRVGIRSLLKAVPAADPERWPVDFFHRSMREYFVAKAIAHALAADAKRARQLLSAAPLLPEIAHFAATILRSESNGAALATLAELTRAATADAGGYLGGNAFTLLHGAGGQLAERDWAGLCLDHARLRGADLHGARLAGSTLRYANLDNANLEDADLTGADLEGVHLEETSQVLAVTALDGMRIIAAYEDRSLREWRGRPGAGWESRLIATLGHRAERLQVTPLGRVLAAGEGMISVLDLAPGGDRSAQGGGDPGAAIRCAFRTSSRSRAVVLGSRTSLFAEEQDGGKVDVTWLDMAARRAQAEVGMEVTLTACAQLDGARLVLASPETVRVVRSVGETTVMFGLADSGVTCLAVRADGDGVLLAAGHQDGSVSLRRLGPGETGAERPPGTRRLHAGPVTDIFLDAEERVITGSTDRSVCVVPVSAIRPDSSGADERDSDVQRLHLTLRCRGVRFDGVRTEREREKLRRYAES